MRRMKAAKGDGSDMAPPVGGRATHRCTPPGRQFQAVSGDPAAGGKNRQWCALTDPGGDEWDVTGELPDTTQTVPQTAQSEEKISCRRATDFGPTWASRGSSTGTRCRSQVRQSPA